MDHCVELRERSFLGQARVIFLFMERPVAVWGVIKKMHTWIGSLAWLDSGVFASCVSAWVSTKVLFVL